jgi:transposase
MDMSRFVGIDLALKAKHRAVVLDGPEVRGKPFAVEMSREGLENLLQRAGEAAEGPVSFVMEPTGLAWLPVSAYVHAAGHRTFLTKPQKLSDLRKFYRRHTKTDVVDAEAAARLPQVDPKGVHELQIPTAEETTFRQLVKRRERLAREAAAHKRRIHALLVLANPGLMTAFGEEKFTGAKIAFLRKYVDPERVLRLGEKRLARFWDRASKGPYDPEVASRVFEACRTAADLYAGLRASNSLPFDYAVLQEEVQFELDELGRKHEAMRKLDQRINEIYDRVDPDRTLEQLRGVSTTIAAAVQALVGDVRRFPRASSLVSYCGLCPRKKQTGMSDPHMPITKAGQRLLKKYLYLAADVARQWDPDFAAYYARRYAAGDHHNRILIALARKMACRVYALLARRARARDTQDGPQQVRYVLRDTDGSELSPQAARAIIVAKYSRKVVAPRRDAADRRRKGRAETPPRAKLSGRPEDATRPIDGSPAPPIHISDLLRQALSPVEKVVDNTLKTKGTQPADAPKKVFKST